MAVKGSFLLRIVSSVRLLSLDWTSPTLNLLTQETLAASDHLGYLEFCIPPEGAGISYSALIYEGGISFSWRFGVHCDLETWRSQVNHTNKLPPLGLTILTPSDRQCYDHVNNERIPVSFSKASATLEAGYFSLLMCCVCFVSLTVFRAWLFSCLRKPTAFSLN